MKKIKKFNTIQILNDLEETLYRTLKFPLFSKYSLEKDKKDPTTGIIQIDFLRKSSLKRKDIEGTIKDFYSKRDYKVIQTNLKISVKKEKISNCIFVSELDSAYRIDILKDANWIY